MNSNSIGIALCFLKLVLVIPIVHVMSVQEYGSTNTIIEYFDVQIIGLTNNTFVGKQNVWFARKIRFERDTDICVDWYYKDNPNKTIPASGMLQIADGNEWVKSVGQFKGTLGGKYIFHPTMVDEVFSDIGISGFSGCCIILLNPLMAYSHNLIGKMFSRLFDPTLFIGHADHVRLDIIDE